MAKTQYTCKHDMSRVVNSNKKTSYNEWLQIKAHKRITNNNQAVMQAVDIISTLH